MKKMLKLIVDLAECSKHLFFKWISCFASSRTFEVLSHAIVLDVDLFKHFGVQE